MLPKLIPAVLVCASVVHAAPSHEPDAALVSKLLNLKSRNRTPGVNVAMILEGTIQSGPFQTSHGRRAVTLLTEAQQGRQIRKAATFDLHWTESYGWFLYEIRQDPAGEEIWIWSERLGEIVIR
jgi:hypothetical protein